MKLTLIRHGETEGSRRDLYYGAADIPVLPDSLKALEEKVTAGVYPTAGRYCISGMLRTVQTLRALYGNVPYTVLPGLREMDFGDFEMRAYAGDLENDPAFRAWCEDAEHNVCPHGESVRHAVRLLPGAGHRISGDFPRRKARELYTYRIKEHNYGLHLSDKGHLFPRDLL